MRSARDCPERRQALEAAVELLDGWMLFHEPSTHTRLRHPLARSFTPRAVGRLQDRVQDIADRLVDDLVAQRSADLVTSFSHPLPSVVIAELFGVPPQLETWLAERLRSGDVDLDLAVEELLRFVASLEPMAAMSCRPVATSWSSPGPVRGSDESDRRVPSRRWHRR